MVVNMILILKIIFLQRSILTFESFDFPLLAIDEDLMHINGCYAVCVNK